MARKDILLCARHGDISLVAPGNAACAQGEDPAEPRFDRLIEGTYSPRVAIRLHCQ